MSNCSQNCWINWNSAVLCFKQLVHIGVWTFARFVRPLLATILCVWKLGPRVYNVSHISMLAKQKRWPKKKKKKCHRTNFEADRWPNLLSETWIKNKKLPKLFYCFFSFICLTSDIITDQTCNRSAELWLCFIIYIF